jgi:hypothetical protein
LVLILLITNLRLAGEVTGNRIFHKKNEKAL